MLPNMWLRDTVNNRLRIECKQKKVIIAQNVKHFLRQKKNKRKKNEQNEKIEKMKKLTMKNACD